MKMGIKEFRERISEVAKGTEAVEVTFHGRVIGDFRPRRFDSAAARRAAEEVKSWQEKMRADGVEPEDWLAEIGLDPWGAPLQDRR